MLAKTPQPRPHGSPAFAEDDEAGQYSRASAHSGPSAQSRTSALSRVFPGNSGITPRHSRLPPRHSRERGNPPTPHGSPAVAEGAGAGKERGNSSADIRCYYRQLSRLSAGFATLTDASMLILGGELKRRERLSARLGDVLSFIYLASACLKHFRDQGEPAEDLPLLRWGVEDLLAKIEQAMHEILLNFPDRAMSIALRVVIFPLGRHLKLPSDRTARHVARLIMTPGPARDRLLEGCYVSHDPDDVTGLLNDTLNKVVLADPLEQRLAKAQRSGELEHDSDADDLAVAAESGVLSPDEAKMVRDARIARRAVIEVDDFSQEEMRPVKAGGDQKV
ncbi:MAG: DUF1974 domain-containing protein [Pseudomonas sp.]